MLTLTIVLSLLTVCFADNDSQCQLYKVKRYLYEYGYLQADDESALQSINESDITNALYIFQEYYKLPTDGELNNETEYLMSKPRCGNEDNISDYRVSSFKWNKPTVTWHYYLANSQVLELTKKAFSLWEEKSGIRFIHNRTNTDILISNRRFKHMMQKESWQCPKVFDGKGGTLAHAYYPDYNNSRREIHIDEDEEWSYEIENIDVHRPSLFATLIHEIGHAIGLGHSDVADSVMFAYYNGKIELSDDDVLAIQNLYGKSAILPVMPSTLSPTSPSTEEVRPIDTSQIDLCNFENINMFLIANKRMYILYDKWLWIINPGETTYSKPITITDWLTFLPKHFSKVLAVYQRPSGEIVMFVDSYVYMFDLMTLRLIQGYPKHLATTFNIQPNDLHSVFNSYSGKTFVLLNDNYYREVNECTFSFKSWGYISDVFPGIPPKVDSSFRYIDGNLYFFKNKTVYIFNEFTNELVKTERNNLSIFGLKCINDNILVKLKELISMLLIQRQKHE